MKVSEPEGVRAEIENAEVLEQETSQLRRKDKKGSHRKGPSLGHQLF